MHVKGFKEPITVIRQWLEAEGKCVTVYADQHRPFTHVRLGMDADGTYLEGIGYSCHRFPDEWSEEEGRRLARVRAKKDIAHQLVDGGFLPPNCEMHEDGVHVVCIADFVLLEVLGDMDIGAGVGE